MFIGSNDGGNEGLIHNDKPFFRYFILRLMQRSTDTEFLLRYLSNDAVHHLM